jgi:preprotein translocase subunit SecF
MYRHHSTCILFFLGALLLFQPLTASAKYLIEFADGQRMTVSNYEQAGDTVKVHTSLGSFAFRKDDVVHITDLNPREKKKPVAEKVERPVQPKKEATQGAVLAEKKPQSKPDAISDTQSKEMQDFMSQVEDGLFRMRYMFALIIGLKVFKIFFAASVG